MTLRECINQGDLISCYDHYMRTTARWEEHWWSGVVEIYECSTKWQREYVLDKKQHIVYKKSENEGIDKYFDYQIATVDEIKQGYCAYLVYLNTGRKNLYSKVGYSANPNQRFCALERSYEEWCYVVVKALYYFDNKGAAETMENYMREYYKSKYLSAFVEKDRFVDIHFTEQDIQAFDKKAQEIANLFQF